MPSYTGASKSSIYKKQADLRKAAVGTAKLHNFFQPAAPTQSTTTAMVPSSGGYTVMPQKSTDSNAADSSDWEDVFEVVPQAPAAPPITPETPNTTSESMSDIDISNNNTELPNCTAFLDLTADDEYQPL